MDIRLLVAVAALLWLGIGLALAELIDLNECKNLQEGLRQFQGRMLSEQETRIRVKIEEWIRRAKCDIRL